MVSFRVELDRPTFDPKSLQYKTDLIHNPVKCGLDFQQEKGPVNNETENIRAGLSDRMGRIWSELRGFLIYCRYKAIKALKVINSKWVQHSV